MMAATGSRRSSRTISSIRTAAPASWSYKSTNATISENTSWHNHLDTHSTKGIVAHRAPDPGIGQHHLDQQYGGRRPDGQPVQRGDRELLLHGRHEHRDRLARQHHVRRPGRRPLVPHQRRQLRTERGAQQARSEPGLDYSDIMALARSLGSASPAVPDVDSGGPQPPAPRLRRPRPTWSATTAATRSTPGPATRSSRGSGARTSSISPPRGSAAPRSTGSSTSTSPRRT